MAVNLDKVVAGVPLKVWVIGGVGALAIGIYLRRRASSDSSQAEMQDESGVLPTVALSGAADQGYPEEGNAPPPGPAPQQPSPPRRKPRMHTHKHRHPAHKPKPICHSHSHYVNYRGRTHHPLGPRGKCKR